MFRLDLEHPGRVATNDDPLGSFLLDPLFEQLLDVVDATDKLGVDRMNQRTIAKDPLDPVDALNIVGLGDRVDHFPAQLSGGEQQRVAIARAIAKQPAILLCDEPTGALDSKTGIVVLEAIETVNRELGTTTAIITHNSVTAGMADRVVYLGDGRIVNVEVNADRHPARSLEW